MKQKSAHWAEVINRDLDRMHHAEREAAEQNAVADLIAEMDQQDRARLEARRREKRSGRSKPGGA